MIFSITGQGNDNLLIQVTLWASLAIKTLGYALRIRVLLGLAETPVFFFHIEDCLCEHVETVRSKCQICYCF